MTGAATVGGGAAGSDGGMGAVWAVTTVALASRPITTRDFIGGSPLAVAGAARASIDAGAGFLVSPGLTRPLVRAAVDNDVPILPGVANASDIMCGLDMGLTHFKFFPAEANGGIPALKALVAPFHQCRFCPTGGIGHETAAAWLALEAVLCVGGSWVVSAGQPDVEEIRRRATAAARLGTTSDEPSLKT
ncbi:2-dehydro-3-deoxyphosphogluconate aldolase [Sphingobium sp.]|uniref:2-dehydro-3-deoxyphosphogluconate aldolase n=1 Tax=Sphingobium sp. TaxID=1912891 RepID=UPI0028BF3C2D|nr:2-dehydro-3-deoxyphosphogluconate aldolase [Sphingobium sp.]